MRKMLSGLWAAANTNGICCHDERTERRVAEVERAARLHRYTICKKWLMHFGIHLIPGALTAASPVVIGVWLALRFGP